MDITCRLAVPQSCSGRRMQWSGPPQPSIAGRGVGLRLISYRYRPPAPDIESRRGRSRVVRWSVTHRQRREKIAVDGVWDRLSAQRPLWGAGPGPPRTAGLGKFKRLRRRRPRQHRSAWDHRVPSSFRRWIRIARASYFVALDANVSIELGVSSRWASLRARCAFSRHAHSMSCRSSAVK